MRGKVKHDLQRHTPTREFIDKLDRNGNYVYILKDPDGVTWAIYAEPLLTSKEEM